MSAAAPLTAVVCEDDPQHRRVVRRGLERAGIGVVETASADEAQQAVRAALPDVLLVDLHLGARTGLELIGALRAAHRTALLPIICVTGDGDPQSLADAFAAGADDFVRKPFAAEELACRVRVAVQRRVALGSASPLTGLPGNVALTGEVERRLRAGDHFALAHVDIDHFKPFNDRYGYVRGDGVIAHVAELLVAAAEEFGDPPPFCAHIGGDDFAVVGDADAVRAVCDATARAFDAASGGFYDADDHARGGIETADRAGVVRLHPLVSLSIGVAVHDAGGASSPTALADTAAECRQAAKAQPGSAVVVDRRRGDQPAAARIRRRPSANATVS